MSHSSMVAAIPRLSITGFFGMSGPSQQAEVLHVAGADLDDVGVFFHKIKGCKIHHFGHHRHTGFLANGGQNFKPFQTQSLEGVGGGAGFKGTAPENLRPAALYMPGNGQGLLQTFNGAGTGDHGQVAVADLNVADSDDGVLGFEFTAHQLIRPGHRNYIPHPGKAGKKSCIHRPLVVQDPDGNPFPPGIGRALYPFSVMAATTASI